MDHYAFTDMREASRRLMESMFDSYEDEWVGEEDMGAIVEVSMVINVYNNKSSSTLLHLLHLKYRNSRILISGEKT